MTVISPLLVSERPRDVCEGDAIELPEPLFICVRLGFPGVLKTFGVRVTLGRSDGGFGAGPGFMNWSGLYSVFCPFAIAAVVYALAGLQERRPGGGCGLTVSAGCAVSQRRVDMDVSRVRRVWWLYESQRAEVRRGLCAGYAVRSQAGQVGAQGFPVTGMAARC